MKKLKPILIGLGLTLALVASAVVIAPSLITRQPSIATSTPQPRGPETDRSTPAAPAPIKPGTPSTVSLAQPTGQVLNKTTISLKATDIQTDPAMNTTCQTVPNASCSLKLTGPAGQIKQVGPYTVDESGGTSFNWNAKTLGLTSGSWSAELVASASVQTAVSSAYLLSVNP